MTAMNAANWSQASRGQKGQYQVSKSKEKIPLSLLTLLRGETHTTLLSDLNENPVMTRSFPHTVFSNDFHMNAEEIFKGSLYKGPVKLIEWVKIALLFLHVTSKLFQFTILNLPG